MLVLVEVAFDDNYQICIAGDLDTEPAVSENDSSKLSNRMKRQMAAKARGASRHPLKATYPATRIAAQQASETPNDTQPV